MKLKVDRKIPRIGPKTESTFQRNNPGITSNLKQRVEAADVSQNIDVQQRKAQRGPSNSSIGDISETTDEQGILQQSTIRDEVGYKANNTTGNERAASGKIKYCNSVVNLQPP